MMVNASVSSNECYPSGIRFFSILINGVDSGNGFTISSFADGTKLCDAVGAPEGQDAIQRGLDRLKQWAQENLMRSNGKLDVRQ